MFNEFHQEMMKFLSNSRHSSRNKAIYLLTVRAGLRIGSVAGLLLNDVIDASGKVKIWLCFMWEHDFEGFVGPGWTHMGHF